MLPAFFELAVVTGVANGTCIAGNKFFKLTPNNSGVATGTCITGTESSKLTPKNLKRDTILGEATLEEAILEGATLEEAILTIILHI